MASLSYEKQFPLQYNRGWGSTLNLLNKYPAISKRIFAKFDYALEFINNTGDSAVEGLILTVVNDGDKNGAYLVNSIGTTENPSGGTLVKLGSSTDIIALDNKLNEHLSAYTEFCASAMTDSEFQTWIDGTYTPNIQTVKEDAISSAQTYTNNAIDALDAVVSGSSTNVSVTVTQENGKITDVGVSQSPYAASDVTITNTDEIFGKDGGNVADAMGYLAERTNEVYTWTVNEKPISGSPILDASDINCDYKGETKTVQEAISALQNRPSGGGGSDVDLSEIERDIATLSGDVASKTIILDDNGDDANPITEYILYQGKKEIGKIVLPEIPKDLVVTSGAVIVATAEDAELNEGETYLKLIIANAEGTPVYIPVNELVDVYSGDDNYISVSKNKISLNIDNVDEGIINIENGLVKAAIDAAAKAGTDAADEVQGNLDSFITGLEAWSDELSLVLGELNNCITSAETAAKNFATESINALDAVVSGSSTNVSVTVTQENGKITNVGVSQSPYAASDVSYSTDSTFIEGNNVDSALKSLEYLTAMMLRSGMVGVVDNDGKDVFQALKWSEEGLIDVDHIYLDGGEY